MRTRQNSSKQDPQPVAGTPWILRFIFKAVLFFGGLGLCGVLLASMAMALAWPNLPDLHAMTDYRPRIPLRVYTADNTLIGEFGEERRDVLRFSEIPDLMKAAVLSAEDDRFYQHGGVDWTGVIRAAVTNLVKDSKAQGASTITMQVARNFYLSSEKTYSRKFYELLLTFKIESQLSKDQILELYMNQIYLGHRAYGFAAAARTYFGKKLSELTPAEAAMLAGIPKAPSRFNPLSNLNRAEVRQHYVLGRMLALGYLTQPEYQAAMTQKIVTRSSAGTAPGTFQVHGEYVAELARQLLYNIYHDDLYTRGINIYTTVRAKDQQLAYESLRNGVLDYTRRAPYPGPEEDIDLPAGIEQNPQKLDDIIDAVIEKYPDSGDDLLTGVVLSANPTEIKIARSSKEIITVNDKKALSTVARALGDKAKPDVRIKRGSVVYVHKDPEGNWEVINYPAVQAAFVVLAPKDGSIRAMVGGFDFYRGNFNRVTQAWRQPGSNIKPFIYAAAIERGFSTATQISNEPFFLTAAQTGSKAWAPKNYGDEYEPMLTLRQALYKSMNMVTVRIMQAIGPSYAQQYLTRFGFDKSRQPAVLPMALGAGTVTPLQLAAAYSVFANGGFRVTPYLIDHVTDSDGKTIMQAKPAQAGDESIRAIDPRVDYIMNNLLEGVATYGTGARAHAVLKRTVAGKTGTTNDSMDAWFSGYTSGLEATAWLGYDQPKSLGARETGGGVALPIWLGYMQETVKDLPMPTPRTKPDGVIEANNELYLSDYPPGQSVASLGLGGNPQAAAAGAAATPAQPDSLGDFLNNLAGSSKVGH